MPIITRRPTSTVQVGLWSLTGGATLHGILADNTDSSYISTTSRAQLESQFAVVDIADLTSADIPDGAQVKSVALKIRVKQVTPSGGGSFLSLGQIIQFVGEVVEEALHLDIFGVITSIFRLFFHFPVPTPPGGGSPVFQTLTVRTWTERPAGGAWTRDAINAQTWKLGRSDITGQTSQVSELYIDIDYNERPSVVLTGPSEVRAVTDAATISGSTTLTSATADFDSADVGAVVVGSGIPVNTTITSVTDATTVVLSAAATVSASGVSVTITRSTITDRTRPLVTATYDDAEGDPQKSIRFRIFTAAQVAAFGFDVETTIPFHQSPGTGGWMDTTSTQWLVDRDLGNGDYVVYAQVRQQWTGVSDHASAWTSRAFTVAVPGPPRPVLVATPNNLAGWNQLDVSPSDVDPATETYTFEFSDDGGLTWGYVYGGWQVQADADGLATVFDLLAPLNINRFYRVTGYRTVSSIKVASVLSETVAAAVQQLEFQFVDPLVPSLSQPAPVMGDAPFQERPQAVHEVLGDGTTPVYKVVVNGQPWGIEGTMVLLNVEEDGEGFLKFQRLWKTGHTVLWKHPTGRGYWIKFGSKIEWDWRTDGATGVWFYAPSVDYVEQAPPLDPNGPGA